MSESKETLALAKINYLLIAAGTLVVVIGFALMSGGGSEDPSVFSDGIFNFRRLSLAPIVVLIGYIVVMFGIMKKPTD